MSFQERRRHPRIAKTLSLQLTHQVNELVTETTNISESGAHCTVNRFLPLMTKLQVKLAVPDTSKPQHATPLTCEGIVVRIDPAHEQPRQATYRIAIFFHDLTERDRTVLGQYVQHHLPQSAV